LVQTHCRKIDLTPFVLSEPVGAKSKVANGGVAVGLPHRNSTVLKQTPINQWEVKRKNKEKARGEHQRIDIRRSIKKGGLKAIT